MATDHDEAQETALKPFDLIRLPTRHNHTLRQLIERINAHTELRALWQPQKSMPSTAAV